MFWILRACVPDTLHKVARALPVWFDFLLGEEDHSRNRCLRRIVSIANRANLFLRGQTLGIGRRQPRKPQDFATGPVPAIKLIINST